MKIDQICKTLFHPQTKVYLYNKIVRINFVYVEIIYFNPLHYTVPPCVNKSQKSIKPLQYNYFISVGNHTCMKCNKIHFSTENLYIYCALLPSPPLKKSINNTSKYKTSNRKTINVYGMCVL